MRYFGAGAFVNSLVWVLGIHLVSSWRAASVLNLLGLLSSPSVLIVLFLLQWGITGRKQNVLSVIWIHHWWGEDSLSLQSLSRTACYDEFCKYSTAVKSLVRCCSLGFQLPIEVALPGCKMVANVCWIRLEEHFLLGTSYQKLLSSLCLVRI